MAPANMNNPVNVRLDAVERDVQDIKSQMRQATSDREYDLRIHTLEDKIDAISVHQDTQIRQYNSDMKEIRDVLSQLNTAIQAQKIAFYRVQISALIGIVSTFLVIVTGVVVYLLTHNITQ